MGGGGCNFKYPDCLIGESIVWDLVISSYTVPSGKNLYITNIFNDNSDEITVDGIRIQSHQINSGSHPQYNHPTLSMPFIFKEGQVISITGNNLQDKSFNGFLTDALADPITWDLQSSYIVPSGKRLYITNIYSEGGDVEIDGVQLSSGNFNRYYGGVLALPFIVKEGQNVSEYSSTYSSFNGYLVDENYFAGCGGGGSSSTSSLDSTTIANMIAGAGGGCNMKFPEGYDGEPISVAINNSNLYTVPSGK